MGNRSRYVAAAAALGAGSAIAARRRARLRLAARGIHDAILPGGTDELLADPPGPSGDVAHAPGHSHLAPPQATRHPTRRARSRPWTKHGHGMTHPYSGN